MAKWEITLCLAVVLLIAGCGISIQNELPYSQSADRYVGLHPDPGAVESLETALNSVYKLVVIIYYRQFLFNIEDQIRPAEVADSTFHRYVRDTRSFNSSVIGTATVIDRTENRVALLTCAHVVDKPDTLFTHFTGENNRKTPYLRSFSLRQRHHFFLAEVSALGNLEILAMDRDADLAVLGGTLPEDSEEDLSPLPYSFGSVHRLSWGSLVYVLGYPWGKRMVTSGIASLSSPGNHTFTIDAPFNQGMSGGLVLAHRDDPQQPEILGITNTTSGEYEARLAPPDTLEPGDYSTNVPYDGELYIRYSKKISYGVTNVVPIDRIIRFLKSHEASLKSQGYDLNNLYD